jgi:hypothetical protein
MGYVRRLDIYLGRLTVDRLVTPRVANILDAPTRASEDENYYQSV